MNDTTVGRECTYIVELVLTTMDSLCPNGFSRRLLDTDGSEWGWSIFGSFRVVDDRKVFFDDLSMNLFVSFSPLFYSVGKDRRMNARTKSTSERTHSICVDWLSFSLLFLLVMWNRWPIEDTEHSSTAIFRRELLVIWNNRTKRYLAFILPIEKLNKFR